MRGLCAATLTLAPAAGVRAACLTLASAAGVASCAAHPHPWQQVNDTCLTLASAAGVARHPALALHRRGRVLPLTLPALRGFASSPSPILLTHLPELYHLAATLPYLGSVPSSLVGCASLQLRGRGAQVGAKGQARVDAGKGGRKWECD